VNLQDPTQVSSGHVVNCSCQSVSCFLTVKCKMSFSQVQRLFTVEHYPVSRSYATCHSEFRDTFPDSPVLNKSTIVRLVNGFRNAGSVQDINRSNMRQIVICIAECGGHFQHLMKHRFLFYFSAFYFQQIEHVSALYDHCV
jgi:hypothetical protein